MFTEFLRLLGEGRRSEGQRQIRKKIVPDFHAQRAGRGQITPPPTHTHTQHLKRASAGGAIPPDNSQECGGETRARGALRQTRANRVGGRKGAHGRGALGGPGREGLCGPRDAAGACLAGTTEGRSSGLPQQEGKSP